jgi:hypothetical protein
LRAVEKSLAQDFSGSSLRPVHSRLVRSSLGLEVNQNQFSTQANLGPDNFVQELRSALAVFSTIVTAEFQLTSIEANSASPAQLPRRLQTRVRYELVGTGKQFYREQRVG